jgi:ribonuclease HI
MMNHIFKDHKGKIHKSHPINTSILELAPFACPHCGFIYHGIRKHAGPCGKLHGSTAVHPSQPRTRTLLNRSLSSFDIPMPTTPHPEHPLPLVHPRVWEYIPRTLVDRIVDLVRVPLITYGLTTDLNVKTEIVTELHRLPNVLLQKIRGDRGKTLTRLSNRLQTPSASRALFAAFANVGLPRSPSHVPSAAVPAIEIWTDGSCSHAEPGRRGKTGIGLVVVDKATSTITARHSYFLGNGTNGSAELNAILFALDLYAASPLTPLQILSDSKYAIGACGTNAIETNQRIILQIRKLLSLRNPKPIIEHVDAHTDNKHNNEADRLAKLARTTEKPLPPASSILSHPHSASLVSSSTLSASAALFVPASISSSVSVPPVTLIGAASSTAAPSLSSSSSSVSSGHDLQLYVKISKHYICDHCRLWYSEAYMCHQHPGNPDCDYAECHECHQRRLTPSTASTSVASSAPCLSAPSSLTHPIPSLSSNAASAATTFAPSRSPARPIHREEISQHNHDPQAAIRRLVHRAVALARLGHLRRAVQTLERRPLPELTPARIAHLLSLHPRRTQEIRPPDDLANCVTPIVEPAALLKLIRWCDKGAAAGPSNLTAAHLVAIASDKDCLSGLCAIVQDVINGDLQSAAIDIITGATSVATDKGGDSVRPLAVPEIIYKLAGLVCLESIADSIPSLFPRIQLGCGMAGGTEIAIHRTQLALETGGPGTVVLRLDFRNAFNERHRHIIAQALFSAPSTSRIWKFFVMAYGRDTHMAIYDRGRLIDRFLSSEGVKQGCPIASFLYALSVQHIYEECVRGTPDVQAYAIADDLTLTGPALSVLTALNTLVRLCASNDGPTLNLTKCEALWAYNTNHPSYQPFIDGLREHNVPISHDTVEMLGSTIGLGMKRAAHCLAVVEQQRSFFAAIAHPDMPAQIAILLLRLSGVPRLTYLTRVTPPIVIREAAERFDELVVTTAAAKVGLPDPRCDSNTHLILTLPLRLDGIGLRPHTRSSPCAYWASMAACARSILDSRSVEVAQNQLRTTDTFFHLSDTHTILCAAGVDPSDKTHRHALPATLDDFWSLYAGEADVKPHLQGHLTTAVDNAYYLRNPTLLPITASAPSSSDIAASDAPPDTAHVWLTAIPNSHDTNINSQHFCSALRHRYNLPAADRLPPTCKCGLNLTPAHFHSCILNRRAGVLMRHDNILRTIMAHARRAGIVVRREPPVRDAKGNRTIPDFQMLTHVGPVHVDVSICSTYATTNLNRRNPIHSREQSKSTKYDATCADNNSEFIPCVLDSVGRMGNGCRRVIDLIVTQHHVNGLPPDPQLRNTIIEAISVQLQVGNAMVDASALTQLGNRSAPPVHPEHKQRPHPPMTHNTLRRPPAASTLIPSIVASSSNLALPAPAHDIAPDRESKSPRLDPDDAKRTGPIFHRSPAPDPDHLITSSSSSSPTPPPAMRASTRLTTSQSSRASQSLHAQSLSVFPLFYALLSISSLFLIALCFLAHDI